MISEESFCILEDIYERLSFESKNKGYQSIWEYAMNVKNNSRYEMLYQTAAKFVPQLIADELLVSGLIRPSKDEGDYIITAYGIFEIEKRRGYNTLNNLIALIDDRYFTIEVKGVSSREKIILFAMVMIRCFSENNCIDARKDDSVKDYWMEIFVKAQNQLKKYGVIEEKAAIEELGKKSDIEHPMSNIVRHTDALDTKVKMIFKKTGKNQYYLNLSKDQTILVEDLTFIIKTIFENKISLSNIDDLIDFCNESSKIDGIYVLDIDQPNFIDSDYDEDIKKAFYNAFEGDIFL